MNPVPSATANASSGPSSLAEAQRLRNTLHEFEKTIEYARLALDTHAAEAIALDREWSERENAHKAKQQTLLEKGNALGRLLEDLSYDIDILKHNFRRSMLRLDQKHGRV